MIWTLIKCPKCGAWNDSEYEKCHAPGCDADLRDSERQEEA